MRTSAIESLAVLLLAGAAAAAPLGAQRASGGPSIPTSEMATGVSAMPAIPAAAPDLTRTPTIYAVGYAHLDTEWRWEYPQVIREYLAKTMHDNFALFEKYPDYVFNFSGANRYRLMKEYYPADYAKVTQYVHEGRWFPAGSSMEEGDVNAPSAEGIIRQILYGNEYFRKDFGVASQEYMLPDCFGFPWSLPSILAYSGVKGFSTQKLVWGSSVPDDSTTPYGMEGQGIPFNFGTWVGPDGKGVLAALNPGSYSARVGYDLSRPEASDSTARPRKPPQTWLARLEENKKDLGLIADYHYYGTGDTGGAPSDSSVMFIERAVRDSSGPVKVISAKADQFFLDIKPDQAARLPKYAGEMELQNHSAGSLTSEGYQKRWIHENELLAQAAEEASVGAALVGDRPYPLQRLTDAWTLMMGGHFHDIAAGTATPKSYEFAWNDDVIAMNQMSGIVADATSALAAGMNTNVSGTPVVVYNSLNTPRTDVIEASLPMAGSPASVSVMGPDGKGVPAQVESGANGAAKVVFIASAPSAGYAVYDVRASGAAAKSELHVTDHSLENARYRVTIDNNGDISSIFDKKNNKELLASPARLAIKDDTPEQWPAWNMDFSDEQKAPRGYVGGTPTISISENGPARVALTISRQKDSSTFVQTVRLAAGDAGNRVEVKTSIDWHEPNATLKAMFPLTVSNDSATYNWDVGTIKRGTAYDRKFEVPTHQFIDLTDKSGAYGVTILTEKKNGSDKRDDHTIGLTLLRTPGISPGGRAYADQSSQDWGHHELVYGIAGHTGDYRAAGTDWQAWRLDEPMMSFTSSKHAGALGKSLSLVRVSNPRVRVMAFKRAELSNEYVVRVVELDGKPQRDVRLSFAAPVVKAREVNGQEQPIAGAVTIANGSVVTSLSPFQVRSWAVTFGAPAARVTAPASRAVALQYDRATASNDGTPSGGGFNAKGEALPAEMLPQTLPYDGVTFTLAPAKTGTPNAVVAHGQTIALPAGHYTRAYVLAASANGDRPVTFRAGSTPVDVTVEDWGGYVGQWDNRIWKHVDPTPAEISQAQQQQAQRQAQLRARIDSVARAGGDTTALAAQARRGGGGRGGPRGHDDFAGLTPAFIKPASIAWYASHKHDAAGANEFYEYSYLFAYPIDLPAGATTLTLPNDDAVRVFAVTVANEPATTAPAAPLHDVFGGTHH